MRLNRLSAVPVLALTLVSLATAPSTIRLRFELYRNGSLVGSPALSVASGDAARLAFDGAATITFTPASLGSDNVSIDFDIDSGGRRLRPRLVIGADAPGSVTWSSAGGRDTFTLTIAWLR